MFSGRGDSNFPPGATCPRREDNYFFTGAVFMLGNVFMGSPGLPGPSGMGSPGCCGVVIAGLSVGWTVPGFDMG